MMELLQCCFRSIDEPPRVPIFTGGREKRPNHVQALTSAVTEMAKAISTPRGNSSTECTSGGSMQNTIGISPSKIANLRSNYLQQLRDLATFLAGKWSY